MYNHVNDIFNNHKMVLNGKFIELGVKLFKTRVSRGVPALYQSLGGSGKGYPDPSSRLASRVELPKITISVVENLAQ